MPPEIPAALLDRLCEKALEARTNAYAPFSNFLVGSAALTETLDIVRGVNVENSSYGLTICAERVAATAAITNGAKGLLAVAVATEGGSGPCGACRQFLYEFGPEMQIILIDVNTPTQRRIVCLGELLPDGFRLETTP